MFSKVALVFVFCLVQVYSTKVCDYLDYCYCTCLSNPKAAIDKYDTSLKEYRTIMDAAKIKTLTPYMPLVAKWKNGTVCSNKYFKSDFPTMAADLLSLCGGSPLGTSYDPDWDSLKTPEETCNYIFAKGPTMCKHMNVNLGVRETCNVTHIMDVLDHSFKVCEEGCTDEHLLDFVINI